MARVKLVYDVNKGLIKPMGNAGTDGKQSGVQPRICYVDDTRTSPYVTIKVLNQHGFHVEHYEQGESALEVLLDQSFDLLLMDYAAPRSDGLGGEHLIRIIRGSGHPRNAVLPIVVLASNSEIGTLNGLKQAGANEIVMKPFKGKELDQVIRRLVANYRAALGLPPIPVTPVGVKSDSGLTPPKPAGMTAAPRKAYTSEELERRFGNIALAKATPETESARQDKSPREIPVLEQAVRAGDERVVDSADSGELSTQHAMENVTIIDARLVDAFPVPLSRTPAQLAIIDARGETIVESSLSTIERVSSPAPRFPTATSTASSVGRNEESASIAPPLDNGLLDLLEKLEHGQPSGGAQTYTQRTSSSNPFKTSWLESTKKKFSLKLVSAIAIAALAVYGIQKYSAKESTSFNVVLVERGPIYEAITVPAKVTSKRLAEVTSFSPGQLTKIEVKEGESVTKGQPLALMDDRDAQSAVNRAQANAVSAHEEASRSAKNLERMQRALELGAVSRQRVEDVEGEWRAAVARENVVEEELRSAKLALERLRIVAPFDGVVTSISAHSGKWIAPPEPIMTVVDIGAQEVVARVDAADASIIQVGQEVALSNESFAGKKWTEKVSRVAAAAKKDNATNSIDVVITLGNDAPPLRVGQQIDAEIRLRGNANALKIPVQSLINKSGTPSVAVLRGDKVHFVEVVTGIEDIASVEIVRGLEDGEQVVVSNGKELAEGQRIRVVSGS